MRTGRRDRWSSRSAGAYVALGRWQTNGAGARDRSAGGRKAFVGICKARADMDCASGGLMRIGGSDAAKGRCETMKWNYEIAGFPGLRCGTGM